MEGVVVILKDVSTEGETYANRDHYQLREPEGRDTAWNSG